jgi:hypothetical protein
MDGRCSSGGFKVLKKKATAFWFCNKTAEMVCPEASVSTQINRLSSKGIREYKTQNLDLKEIRNHVEAVESFQKIVESSVHSRKIDPLVAVEQVCLME